MYHIIYAINMSNQLIYNKSAASLYNVSAMGMMSASIYGPKLMTRSINVWSNLLRNTIINSMSNNRAAKCHNVAGVIKE
jgi:hypothetical protein